MKKILFAIVLIIISSELLKAQTNKGRVFLGGSSTLGLVGTGSDIMHLGYSSTKYKNDADGFEELQPDKRTNINFYPKLGSSSLTILLGSI